MHYAAPMGGLDGLGDLPAEPEHLRDCQRSPAQPVLEGLALEVLHDQVVHPLLGAHVVDRADVRVVKLREGPRFALEALAELWVLRQVLGKDLDRHVTPETGVPGLVHLAHAAPAERRQKLVPTQSGARFECHRIDGTLHRGNMRR